MCPLGLPQTNITMCPLAPPQYLQPLELLELKSVWAPNVELSEH